MLFFTNFTAIVISADLVFLLIGFRPRQVRGTNELASLVKRRILIASAVLLALSIPLLRTLLKAAQQATVRRDVAATLHRQFDRSGRRVASLEIKAGQNPIVIDSVVQTQDFIEAHEINSAEAAVREKLRMPVHLIVEQVQLAHQIAVRETPLPGRGNDFLAGSLIRREGLPDYGESVSEILSRSQDRVGSMAAPLLRPAGVESLIVKALAIEQDGTMRVELTGKQPRPNEPSMWRVLAAALERDLGEHVHIIATLDLADPGELDVHFRQNSTQVLRGGLHKAAQFVSPWKRKAGIRIAFMAASNSQASLLESRIRRLNLALALNEKNGVAFDHSIDVNTIRLKVTQWIDVNGNESETGRAE